MTMILVLFDSSTHRPPLKWQPYCHSSHRKFSTGRWKSRILCKILTKMLYIKFWAPNRWKKLRFSKITDRLSVARRIFLGGVTCSTQVSKMFPNIKAFECRVKHIQRICETRDTRTGVTLLCFCWKLSSKSLKCWPIFVDFPKLEINDFRRAVETFLRELWQYGCHFRGGGA